jgi:hypothetical protein
MNYARAELAIMASESCGHAGAVRGAVSAPPRSSMLRRGWRDRRVCLQPLARVVPAVTAPPPCGASGRGWMGGTQLSRSADAHANGFANVRAAGTLTSGAAVPDGPALKPVLAVMLMQPQTRAPSW